MHIRLHLALALALLSTACGKSSTPAPPTTAAASAPAPTSAASTQASLTLRGRLVLAGQPNSPVTGAKVFAKSPDVIRRFTESDSSGNFEIPSATSEMYALAITPDHKLASIFLIKPGDNNLTIPLIPTATVHGRLLNDAGKPWPKQTIMYGIMMDDSPSQNSSGPGGRPAIHTVTSSFGGSVKTNDDGAFNVQGLVPEHEYTLTVFAKRGASTLMHLLARTTPHSDKPIDLGDVPPAPAAATQIGSITESSDEAIEQLKKLGGQIFLGGPKPGDLEMGLAFSRESRKAVTDATLRHLKNIDNLRSLNLAGTSVTDAGLEQLKGLKDLKRLNLNGTEISDAGLKEIAALDQLETLDLDTTKITDAGLKTLQAFHKLKRLDLAFTNITDAGLDHLKELAGLERLNLGGTEVTDEAIKKLQSALPNCDLKK